jgi:hypothetical protein
MDTVITHIISPYPISISKMTMSIWYYGTQALVS